MPAITDSTDAHEFDRSLFQFIDASPTPFHAVRNIEGMLVAAGFVKLSEKDAWDGAGATGQAGTAPGAGNSAEAAPRVVPGGRYFVTRNNSSIIAFAVPGAAPTNCSAPATVTSSAPTSQPAPGKTAANAFSAFKIIASHSDSPCFKIKENPEMPASGAVKLNVERYGGMIASPWLDRPLSIAGRVVVETECGLEERLVNIDRDLVLIPNLCVHFNREAHEGYSYNAQKDLLPVFALEGSPIESGSPKTEAAPQTEATPQSGTTAQNSANLLELVAQNAGVPRESILSHDLYLYNRDRGTFWGAQNEFIASPRLDDLECAYASLCGFLAALDDSTSTAGNGNGAPKTAPQSGTGSPSNAVTVCAVFDNEEVGSGSKQGADSTFLEETLERIALALGKGRSELFAAYANSFLISADNAHAVHPNYPEKSDPVNQPKLNGGPVLKYNAAQKYCTDAVSAATFKALCKKAGVPCQVFTNRSDVAGGSTLGNISLSHVSMNGVDIGLPQWAMHSPCESAGAQDPLALARVAREFYR